MQSNDNGNNNSYSGPSFMGLLFLVFLTLKLTGHIDWSWWWVTAPLWGQLALALLLILLCIVFGTGKR